MSIARIRTIKEAYAEIKEADPKTAITQSYIRRLIVSGTVPSAMAGRRYLVNMDELEIYLNNPDRQGLERQREYEQARCKIRAVPE